MTKATPEKEISTNSPVKEKADEERFINQITRLCALSMKMSGKDEFDITEAVNEANSGINALNSNGNLQKMLVSQMLSIHQLQQVSCSLANSMTHPNSRQFFTNSTIKLANCFTQQATLLARLQGQGGQKITVERVDVHQGGQAIVGNIHTPSPDQKEKK